VIGEIKLKYFTKFMSGVGFPEELQGKEVGDFPFMKVSDINGPERIVKSSNNYVDVATVKKNGWKPIEPNSIVMAKIGAALTKNHRKILSEATLVDNNMLAVTPSGGVDAGFFYWVWRFIDLTKYQNISSVPSVNMDELRNAKVMLPPLEIQKKLATYLDQKTAAIDAAIEKKRRLLGLIDQKRISIIDSTIRAGVGVKVKIKHVAFINPNGKRDFTGIDVASFIPMEAVGESGQLVLQERPLDSVSSGYTYVEENDVVLAKITPCFENGKAAVVRGLRNKFAFGTTEFIVMRPGTRVEPDYLYYVVYSKNFRENGTNEMRGSAGQKRVTENYVANYEFNLPTIQNQKNVIKLLRKSLLDIDNVRDKIQDSVSQLEEYRASLISNIIAGRQSDVG